jgi:glucose/arabinose dehydrogenase
MEGRKMLRTVWLAALAVVLAMVANTNADLTDAVDSELITNGISFPTYLTQAPGDDSRLFVTNREGTIHIIKDGALLPEVFLDISGQIITEGEGTLGCLAFHPNYQSNGYFYVTYVDLSGDSVLARFTVGADADHADPTSETLILFLKQPGLVHNLGWIGFGADGYLYISSGDGTNNNGRWAQDLDKLHGKILRIDVDGGSPYGIPPDNPLVGREGLDELWAVGLRNPWRCSFDRATGDLWLGDVGKSSFEEIDVLPAGNTGIANFGWNCMEGNQCFKKGNDCVCDAPVLIDPVLDYDHSQGCAVIGGYIYRGSAVQALTGLYLFGDACEPIVWAMDPATGERAEVIDGVIATFSFGEDHDGELYVLSPFAVRKLVVADCNGNGVADDIDIKTGASDDCNFNLIPDECDNDCNGNNVADDCDIASGTSHDDNANGIPDECDEVADFNGDGLVGVADLLIMLSVWGPCRPEPEPCMPDLSLDGQVTVQDLLILLSRWDN